MRGCVFLLFATAAALRPMQAGVALKQARNALRTRQPPPSPALLASSSPAAGATLTGSIVAGTYTGVMQFTFAAACASVIFAPVGLPLTIGIQHALIGFVIMQCVVTKTTSVPGRVVLSVPSFEVLPFLAKFALICSSAIGAGAPASLLATVLVGSILVNILSAGLLALASLFPVSEISKLLPPPLQAGLFSAIGWSLYLLSYDTLGLGVAASTLFTWKAAMLWLPANLLGVGLWKASRESDSPLLFPGFILATSVLVHAVRLATGTTVDASRAAGWLMAEAIGEPCTALFKSISPSLIRWDVLRSAVAAKQLVLAALFGPLVNTILNFVLYGPMIGEQLDLKHELRSHAAGSAAGALGGGYANYIGISDNAVHRKIGGLDARSCYFAAAVGALFLLAYPLCVVVGYVPTLAIAAICVFIGIDFMYDNLIANWQENGAKIGLAAFAVLFVCVKKDMLWGLLLGIAAAQGVGWWQRRQLKAA